MFFFWCWNIDINPFSRENLKLQFLRGYNQMSYKFLWFFTFRMASLFCHIRSYNHKLFRVKVINKNFLSKRNVTILFSRNLGLATERIFENCKSSFSEHSSFFKEKGSLFKQRYWIHEWALSYWNQFETNIFSQILFSDKYRCQIFRTNQSLSTIETYEHL